MAAPVRRWFTAGLVVVALLGGGWLVVREARAWLGYRLPTEKILFDHEKPPSSIEVLDSEGLVLDYWAPAKHRLYRPLGQIDEKLPRWVVMLEDAKFFQHDGFDFEQIKNSVEENLEKGKIKRGASTITQQLAKNLFLDKDKTLLRKAFEVPWAIRLESDLSKKQILELYLNVIEWGPGVYGAEAAARHYFDRSANELTSGQAMYLALMIPNPKRMDLLQGDHARKELEQRRAQFVRRLVDEKKIEPEQESESESKCKAAGEDHPRSNTSSSFAWMGRGALHNCDQSPFFGDQARGGNRCLSLDSGQKEPRDSGGPSA